jgi:hypothetical protein
MILRVLDIHTSFIGKLSKLTEMGLMLEKEYEILFNIGNYGKAEMLFYYCYAQGRYQINLMFVDEKPVTRDGLIWFCLKEVGVGVYGDLHWFTLDQLIICN